MKRIFFLALILVPTTYCNSKKMETGTAEILVTIEPGKTYQTIEGWGSSLCWWAGQVGAWDQAKVNTIVDLFTDPDKLNMNIFRYNIGGGDNPLHANGHMSSGKGKRAEMEGFKASATAPYNWDADKAQRNILLKIRDKRTDAVFEAFSNSAPYWMTVSGCSGGAGTEGNTKENLAPQNYLAFCNYLVDVCKHYYDQYGIVFRTLEPFNESFSHYWYFQGSQEGCHFEPQSQINVIQTLSPLLEKSNLTTKIAASDETNLNQFLSVMNTYKLDGKILDKVVNLNTHTYSGTNEERKMIAKFAAQVGKPLWVSETGPDGGIELQSSLVFTQKLFNDMRYMKPSAWIDWQLMEEGNREWGLLVCNFKDQSYEILKNYYVRMQITRFFKRGYTMVETGNDQVLAAIDPLKKELVIALLNTSETDKSVKIDLTNFTQKNLSPELYRTSASENCQKIESKAITNNLLNYSILKQSLSTFIIKLGA
jgi:hypothetical protein